VAVECDRYGFKFEATPLNSAEMGLNVLPKEELPESFDLRLPIRRPDGIQAAVDIRTLPFVRFQGNEAHSQLYGINLGERVRGVGPDARHPFVLQDTKLWNNFWAFRPGSPAVLVDGMNVFNGLYGLYRPVFDRHAYSRLTVAQVLNPQAFGQGETPKGFTLPGPADRARAQTLIELAQRRAAELAKTGRLAPGQLLMDSLEMTQGFADVETASEGFPAPLKPLDDLPPTTVITHVLVSAPGKLLVRGTTADGGTVKRVSVNGQEAKSLRPNFAEWEVELSDPDTGLELLAFAEDEAGNVEARPHRTRAARP
jgi:hypothetical protein